jgi:hypothetical protein
MSIMGRTIQGDNPRVGHRNATSGKAGLVDPELESDWTVPWLCCNKLESSSFLLLLGLCCEFEAIFCRLVVKSFAYSAFIEPMVFHKRLFKYQCAPQISVLA